jgi:hypothetical protein
MTILLGCMALAMIPVVWLMAEDSRRVCEEMKQIQDVFERRFPSNGEKP